MPVTFSSMDSLSASYLRNTARKMGCTVRTTLKRPKPSSGTMITNTAAKGPAMMKAMTMPQMSSIGQRTAVRMIIM